MHSALTSFSEATGAILCKRARVCCISFPAYFHELLGPHNQSRDALEQKEIASMLPLPFVPFLRSCIAVPLTPTSGLGPISVAGKTECWACSLNT